MRSTRQTQKNIKKNTARWFDRAAPARIPARIPDRFDADSAKRLGNIANFAYEHGRAGVPTADKARAPPLAARRRHREAFRDMANSLSVTYEQNSDVVFIMIGSGRGGTFAAARKLLYELEFTGNRALALHVDKDKERARHALGTWGRLAHKVTAAVLPVELPVSFELVKYLLALVGLVGTYDISTEAVTRRALLATTLSEHLGVACSARVGVVREHFCVRGPCGARTDTPRASHAPSPSASGRRKTAAPFRRFSKSGKAHGSNNNLICVHCCGAIKRGLKFQTEQEPDSD